MTETKERLKRAYRALRLLGTRCRIERRYIARTERAIADLWEQNGELFRALDKAASVLGTQTDPLTEIGLYRLAVLATDIPENRLAMFATPDDATCYWLIAEGTPAEADTLNRYLTAHGPICVRHVIRGFGQSVAVKVELAN